MELSRLRIAMLTRRFQKSGTDSPITLVVNIGGNDLLRHTFPDTKQKDQEKGQANLYSIDVTGKSIMPNELTNSSIRVETRGTDMWEPEHIMVWGERETLQGVSIVPLAIETNITTQLSNAPDKETSMPLRLVSQGDRNMEINRVFMFLTTAGETFDADIFGGQVISIAKTDSPIEIQIVSQGHLVVLTEIRDTFQDDLEGGGANFYSAPVITPFTRRNLDSRSITLRLKGLDNFEPDSFFLFGLDDSTGRPEAIVPLVSLPSWPYGLMKPDTTNGMASVTLPLIPDRDAPDNVGVALSSISNNQAKIITLLERLVNEQNSADKMV